MAIKKKIKNSKKHNSKKHNSSKKRLNNLKSLKSKTSKNRKFHKHRKLSKRKLRGGFSSSCNLATVKEPGFSVDSLGSIPGLSISDTRASIYRPNCNSDTYNAMIP